MSMHELSQLGVTFRPINQWPQNGRCHEPSERRAPFKASLSNTARLLGQELRHLDAKPGILLEIDLRENDVRLDGMPRADARVGHPGVILTFECHYGTLRPFTDACTTWQHNLRAIAMHLEHLRMASLYGVGRGGEQYRGWKALPAGESVIATMTPMEAAKLIAEFAPNFDYLAVFQFAESFERAFRAAAMKCHPDQGGKPDDFKRLTAARDVLKTHHSI